MEFKAKFISETEHKDEPCFQCLNDASHFSLTNPDPNCNIQETLSLKCRLLGRQVAQSVERRTLEAEVRGSKPVLGTWWWGQIPPNQPYPKGAAPAASTLLAEWWPSIPRKGVNIVGKKERVVFPESH